MKGSNSLEGCRWISLSICFSLFLFEPFQNRKRQSFDCLVVDDGGLVESLEKKRVVIRIIQTLAKLQYHSFSFSLVWE